MLQSDSPRSARVVLVQEVALLRAMNVLPRGEQNEKVRRVSRVRPL